MKKILSLCLAAMGLFVGTCYGADMNQGTMQPAGSQNAQQKWDSSQDSNSNMMQNPSAYNDSQGSYGQGQGSYGSGAYAQGSYDQGTGSYGDNSNGYSGQEQGYYNQEVCCGQPFEHACGDTYQLYCTYKPCYYNEWRTVCEPQCYQKKCCKYVAKEYDKCCVKYVPQYYTQKCCKYEPEYFYTTETREVSRKVCDRKCKYVPQYYYKHICSKAPEACCQ